MDKFLNDLRETFKKKEIKLSEIYNLDLSIDEYEELLECFKNNGITIIEDSTDYKLTDENEQYNTTNTLTEYLREISKYPLLTMEEEKELFRLYRAGNELAKEKLINSNLRFVVYISRKMMFTKYIGDQRNSLDFLDMIQEGNIGLMKAIEKFDVNKSYRLSTYAAWWIKQSIQRAIIETGSNIRIPDHTFLIANKLVAYRNEYFKNNGKEPEVSDYTEMFGYTEEQLKRYLGLEYSFISLQSPIAPGEKNSATLGEAISDGTSFEEELIDKLYDTNCWDKIKKVLTEREYEVLSKRLGKHSDKVYTLDSIGKDNNLSRERIRMIEARAIRKIKMKRKTIFGDNNQ